MRVPANRLISGMAILALGAMLSVVVAAPASAEKQYVIKGGQIGGSYIR